MDQMIGAILRVGNWLTTYKSTTIKRILLETYQS
jgi:hypothetical protein